MNINDYLPTNYVPVYGTGITPDSFRPFISDQGVGWITEGLTKKGEEGRYTILLAPEDDANVDSTDQATGPLLISKLATCEVVVDAAQSSVQHPYSKCIGGKAAVADWFDAIAIEDAEGRKAEQITLWSGNDWDSTLTRVEHKIVAYGSDEVAVESFSSAAEASQWLERALSATQVRAEVWQIRDAFETEQTNQHTLLRRFNNDEVNRWFPIGFSTVYISEEWLQNFFGRGQKSPFVHLRMSGSRRVSLTADYALSWKELNESGELRRDESRLEAGADDWLVIHVVDTDIALPLPWPGASIVVHHDEDGAQVGIDVHVTETQAARHRKERVWESDWGRFLDDGIALTEVEVTAGIKCAEAELNTLIAEEEES